ncbi:MAG TPA: PspC domain-containing protein [Allosphingosinicella sp.]|jgi:phage shock protein C|nr:PspC domain-containing protein [Allosphingosinicella sp.]
MKQPFALDRNGGQIMGVFAGASEATGIDVTMLRIAAVLSLFLLGPISILLYLVTGWIAPAR